MVIVNNPVGLITYNLKYSFITWTIVTLAYSVNLAHQYCITIGLENFYFPQNIEDYHFKDILDPMTFCSNHIFLLCIVWKNAKSLFKVNK